MRFLKSQKGMSIVEIVLALALLGVVSIGASNFFTGSFEFQSRNQQNVAAQKIADQTMEILKENEGIFNNINIKDLNLGATEEVLVDSEYKYILIVNSKDEVPNGSTFYDVTVEVISKKDNSIMGKASSTIQVKDRDKVENNKVSYKVKYYSDGILIKEVNVKKDTYRINAYVSGKENYTFTGWKNEYGVLYENNEEIELTSDLVLNAEWERNKYTISYNSNGGEGYMSDQEVPTGESITLTANTFTRTNYKFLGWSTDGTDAVKYTNKQEITPTSSMTLYAVWERIQYTITYNANSGSGTMNSQTVQAGDKVTLSENKYTRTNYTFKGWSIDSSATSATYTNKQEITPTSSMTLYAVWERIQYTITYNANSGSGTMSDQTVQAGDKVTLSENKYTRTNYTFKGWSTNSSATSATYTNKQEITPTSSMTLYAVWERIQYTITYNANSGSGTMNSQTVQAGDKVTLSENKYTRTNYTFKGWSTNSSATSATYTNKQEITPTSSMTLYAVWKQKVKCTCTKCDELVDEKGEFCNKCSAVDTCSTCGICSNCDSNYCEYCCKCSSCAPQKCSNCGECSCMYDLCTKCLNGCENCGWDPCSECGYCINCCICETTYVLSYDSTTNGGNGEPYSQSYTGTDSSATFTIDAPEPTPPDGKLFIGWSISKNDQVGEYGTGDTITISGDKTLYAIYGYKYYLIFDPNGGEWSLDKTQLILSGENTASSYTFRITANKPVPPSGKTFIGWSINENDTTAQYLINSSITVNPGSTNLYAVWECNHSYTEEVKDEKYLRSSVTCTDYATYYYKCTNCTDHSPSDYWTDESHGLREHDMRVASYGYTDEYHKTYCYYDNCSYMSTEPHHYIGANDWVCECGRNCDHPRGNMSYKIEGNNITVDWNWDTGNEASIEVLVEFIGYDESLSITSYEFSDSIRLTKTEESGDLHIYIWYTDKYDSVSYWVRNYYNLVDGSSGSYSW